MSENVKIARMAADIWNESGWEGVVDHGLLHPQVEYHDDERWPEARSTVGTAGLVERFDEVLEVLGKDAQIELEDVLAAGGDHIVSIFRFRAAARTSGLDVDYRWGYLTRIRNGQIDYIRAYLDPEQALEDAGLSGSALDEKR